MARIEKLPFADIGIDEIDGETNVSSATMLKLLYDLEVLKAELDLTDIWLNEKIAPSSQEVISNNIDFRDRILVVTAGIRRENSEANIDTWNPLTGSNRDQIYKGSGWIHARHNYKVFYTRDGIDDDTLEPTYLQLTDSAGGVNTRLYADRATGNLILTYNNSSFWTWIWGNVTVSPQLGLYV